MTTTTSGGPPSPSTDGRGAAPTDAAPVLTIVGMRLSVACPECTMFVPVSNLAADALTCTSCGAQLPFAFANVLCAGGHVEHAVDQALGLPEGQKIEDASARPDVRLSLERRALGCPSCGVGLSRDEIKSAATQVEGHCDRCGEPLSVRPPHPALVAFDPRLLHILVEGGGGSVADRPHAISLSCEGCGAALAVDGVARRIECRYCARPNIVPAAVWTRLSSALRQPTLLFIVEVQPSDLLRLSYRFDIGHALHDAVDEATVPEVLTMLVRHPDTNVRAAVARNSAAPPKLLEMLAVDASPDVLLAVADARRRNALSQHSEGEAHRARFLVAGGLFVVVAIVILTLLVRK
jgi:Leucine rich repeat variant